MKVREIAEIVSISTERVLNILHTHLSMRKLCARWMPRLLTSDKNAFDDYCSILCCIIESIDRRNEEETTTFEKEKKSFFMMTMHHLTHRTLHRQKGMNWVSNRFRIHRILRVWPPATIICSQTSRDGCVVGVLSRMKKLNEKQKGILEGLKNSIILSREYQTP